jgi:hypothetical protein
MTLGGVAEAGSARTRDLEVISIFKRVAKV